VIGDPDPVPALREIEATGGVDSMSISHLA